MTKITENDIEYLAVEKMQEQGFQYIHGQEIAPDGNNPERESFEDVLLIERLKRSIAKINPNVPYDAQQDALKELQRINSPELIANNETFHRMLTEGIKVTYKKDGVNRGDLVWLVDFNQPENNEFLVINQFTVIENGINKRPDLIIFINGMPLVVIELKNPADENATIRSAFKQLQTYKASIPSLFTYNGFLIISDGVDAKAGSLSAGFTRFMSWKSSDGKKEASHLKAQMEVLIEGMLNKNTLTDILQSFIVFTKSKKEDKKTGVTSIETVKILAAYHQYYAVKKAVESTLRATDIQTIKQIKEDPKVYGLPTVQNQPVGDRKGGVVWHTQGSGKSYSMVFYTGKIVLALNNPTILVITDRNDLDDQLFDTFASAKQLIRQEPVQAENRKQLKELLKVASGGVIFTTIHKFQPEEGNVYEELSDRKNIIVIADDHRYFNIEFTTFVTCQQIIETVRQPGNEQCHS